MSRLVRGSLVRFRIRDVFYPEATEVVRQVTSETRLCGRLLFFSDSGRQRARYAVIEVQGVAVPVIVSVDRLEDAALPREERVYGGIAAAVPPEEE